MNRLTLPPVKATFDSILRRWGIKPSEVTGADKSRNASKARRIIALELRALGYTVAQIATVLKRHHTSVLSLLGRLGARSREA